VTLSIDNFRNNTKEYLDIDIDQTILCNLIRNYLNIFSNIVFRIREDCVIYIIAKIKLPLENVKS